MLDLIIRGGDVVTPQGVIRATSRSPARPSPRSPRPVRCRRESAQRVIDATGQIVMPGGIDPHVHMHHVVDQAGRNAAHHGRARSRSGAPRCYGGTTTLIDFAYWRDGASARRGDRDARRGFRRQEPLRLGLPHHAALASRPPEFAGQLAEAIQAGYPTLKIFTTNILPLRTGRMIDFGDIWEAFQVLAKEGGLGVIHAEDNDIVMHMYAKLIREGRVGFENLAEVHNQLSEDLSFRRVLRLAESVPGTALYMMHVSAATGVAAIAEARAQGPADLRRDPAPVYAVHGRGLQAAQRPDLSHLSLAQVGGGPEGAVGTARSTARSTASRPTSCAAR